MHLGDGEEVESGSVRGKKIVCKKKRKREVGEGEGGRGRGRKSGEGGGGRDWARDREGGSK